jgi:hypothetical protein
VRRRDRGKHPVRGYHCNRLKPPMRAAPGSMFALALWRPSRPRGRRAPCTNLSQGVVYWDYVSDCETHRCSISHPTDGKALTECVSRCRFRELNLMLWSDARIISIVYRIGKRSTPIQANCCWKMRGSLPQVRTLRPCHRPTVEARDPERRRPDLRSSAFNLASPNLPGGPSDIPVRDGRAAERPDQERR